MDQKYKDWIAENVAVPFGRCKEYTAMMAAAFPELHVRCGLYYEPWWNDEKRQHTWLIAPDGTIVDPTAAQYPSGGIPSFYTDLTDELESGTQALVPTGHCANCRKQVCFHAMFCSPRCNEIFAASLKGRVEA